MSELVMPKRPRRLWTAIIALYAQAVLNAGGGVLLLYLAGEEADHGREDPTLSVLGFVSLGIGVVLFLCAALLTRGDWWARYPVIVIEVIGILSGAIALFSGAPTAVVGILLCVLVLVNLFHSEVRLWFDPVYDQRSEESVLPALSGGSMSQDWVEGRIERVLATSKGAGDPTLSAEQQAVAARLVHVGRSALGGKRDEVRAIGEQLHRAGGVRLMRATLHHAEVLSLRQNSVSILREVEMAWDGIGDWLG